MASVCSCNKVTVGKYIIKFKVFNPDGALLVDPQLS